MSYVQRDITVEFTLSDGRTFDNGKGNILTVSGAKCFATVYSAAKHLIPICISFDTDKK